MCACGVSLGLRAHTGHGLTNTVPLGFVARATTQTIVFPAYCHIRASIHTVSLASRTPGRHARFNHSIPLAFKPKLTAKPLEQWVCSLFCQLCRMCPNMLSLTCESLDRSLRPPLWLLGAWASSSVVGLEGPTEHRTTGSSPELR